MITQEDTIFICGMDPETSEDDIAQHFGAIGVIKARRLFFQFFASSLCVHFHSMNELNLFTRNNIILSLLYYTLLHRCI